MDVNAVLAQAQTVLTPTQQAALRGIYSGFDSIQKLQALAAAAPIK